MFDLEKYRDNLNRKIKKLKREYKAFYGDYAGLHDYEVQNVIKSEIKTLKWALKQTYKFEANEELIKSE